jgi:hypothetical protein
MVTLTGRPAAPVSAETVIGAPVPTLTVATANAPVVAKFTMPVLPAVAASATMSGPGAAEAERRRVFRPEVIGAGAVFVHAKVSWTSVGAKGLVGVKAKTKLWAAPAATSTGVLAVPVSALVAGLVVGR